MMMNAKKSSSLNLTRYMFLVPTVIMLLLVCSVSKAELNSAAKSGKKLFKDLKTAVANIDMAATKSPERKKTELPKAVSEISIQANILAASQISVIDTTKKQIIAIKPANKAISLYIDGVKVPMDSVNKIDPASVAQVAVYKDNPKSTNGEVEGYVLVITKANNSPDALKLFDEKIRKELHITGVTKTSTADSANRAINLSIPANKIEKVVINGNYITTGKKDTTPNTQKDKVLERLLERIDTNSLNKVTKIRLNGVTQNKTKTDSLLKAMKGWKVEKDGAVTKSGTPFPVFTFAQVFSGPIDFKDKLIIIDGKEATQKQLKKLSAAQIETINIMYKNAAITKYGDKAKNGVITISTKKGN